MPYSVALKKRAVESVRQGYPIVTIANLLGGSRGNVHRWLKQKDLNLINRKRWKRKLNRAALKQDVITNPDARLVDRAQKFGLSINPIWYALGKMKITQKNKNFSYQERNLQERTNNYLEMGKKIKENI